MIKILRYMAADRRKDTLNLAIELHNQLVEAGLSKWISGKWSTTLKKCEELRKKLNEIIALSAASLGIDAHERALDLLKELAIRVTIVQTSDSSPVISWQHEWAIKRIKLGTLHPSLSNVPAGGWDTIRLHLKGAKKFLHEELLKLRSDVGALESANGPAIVANKWHSTDGDALRANPAFIALFVDARKSHVDRLHHDIKRLGHDIVSITAGVNARVASDSRAGRDSLKKARSSKRTEMEQLVEQVCWWTSYDLAKNKPTSTWRTRLELMKADCADGVYAWETEVLVGAAPESAEAAPYRAAGVATARLPLSTIVLFRAVSAELARCVEEFEMIKMEVDRGRACFSWQCRQLNEKIALHLKEIDELLASALNLGTFERIDKLQGELIVLKCRLGQIVKRVSEFAVDLLKEPAVKRRTAADAQLIDTSRPLAARSEPTTELELLAADPEWEHNDSSSESETDKHEVSDDDSSSDM